MRSIKHPVLTSGLLAAVFALGFPSSAVGAVGAGGVSASGLTLTVAPFSVGGLRYEGGSLDAVPHKEQFVVLNLKTRTLHALPRAIGDGEVVLARVSVADGAVAKVESREPVLPGTRIPRALEKIAQGKPLVVSCFGSSLVAGGRSPNGWQRLLFDPAHPQKRFHVGTVGADGGSNITNNSYGVGGTNARYTVSLLGEATLNETRFKTTAYDCDLAIVALLPNGGEDRDATFEGVVRMFRSRGIEVLLLTDNSNAGKGVSTGLWGGGNFVRKMADRYGCAVADTAAYMLEGELKGEKVFADSIHSAEAGHRKWAVAIAGVLSPGVELKAAPVAYVAMPTLQDVALVPAKIATDFAPVRIGGTEIAGGSSNPPGAIYGAGTPARLSLKPGDSVDVGREGLMAADLIFSATSGFAVEVREADGSAVIKRIDYKAPAKVAARPQTRSVIAASELKGSEGKPYRVTVTGGELQLYAVVYHLRE